MLEEKDYSKQELADALYASNIKPASRMKKLWRELSKAEKQNISDALLVERILNDRQTELLPLNEHHPDPNMPDQFDQEDGLFKFEKRMK